MNLPESKLTKKQTKTVSKTGIIDGVPVQANIEIRYDDECGNGHNSFAITAHIYERDCAKRARRIDTFGCCHDEIVKLAPELAPFIKYHLVSSDSPMHYIANTLYHASDKDCNGYRAGEPCRWSKHLYFDNFPIQIDIKDGMIKFLEENAEVLEILKLEVFKVEHPPEKDGYKFAPKFDFRPTVTEWYKCAFNTEREAAEFLSAIRTLKFRIEKVVTEFSKGKTTDLEAARESACWPDATLAQLQSKEALEAHLPALMNEFKTAMESLGFIY